MLNTKTKSEKETEEFAKEFSKKLRAGDVIALRGGLGVGKTAFVRGLTEGLGIHSDVSSPTFALVHEYKGESITLYHFDMYRINGFEDLYSTGFFDYLESGGILAIEWSELIEGVLPENTITVELSVINENEREITVKEWQNDHFSS